MRRKLEEPIVRSRLKDVLKERHMTQRDLQHAMDVSKNVIWRMTTDGGISRVPLERVIQAADVLGCEPGDLYEMDEKRPCAGARGQDKKGQ